MKDLLSLEFLPLQNRDPKARVLLHGHDPHTNGVFWVRSPTDPGEVLKVMAASGGGWDHVSVSHRRRIPNWLEMDRVKRTFFHPHEVVMQLHVAEIDHINTHDRVLHLWRPLDQSIPLPPKDFV